MAPTRDRILIVENDELVADLVARQVLQAVGYQTFIVRDATAAIAKALQWSPDLILTNINLPGLSAKDLMVALSSQGVATPVILLAPKGQEQAVLQTFRLGAADFLTLPLREAEVLSAVERVLKQVHERRERQRLEQQLQQANQELQQRVRELTTIFAVGKAVTSTTDMNLLMEKVLEGAMRVAQADLGWFLVREDLNKPFTLVAGSHLPASLGVQPGQVWDDGISSLVALSGETLNISGDPLKRFKIAALGQAILITPIKVQRNVIGLLVVMRRQAAAFAPGEQSLLDALADYVSISLVNAHLFRAAEERARSLQKTFEAAQVGDWIHFDLLRGVKKELLGSATAAQAALNTLARDPTARWRADQRQQLAVIQDQLGRLHKLSETVAPPVVKQTARLGARANLKEEVGLALQRSQPFAQAGGISFQVEGDAGAVALDGGVLGQVLDGLLSNAVRFSAPASQVVLRMETNSARQALLAVRSTSAAPLDQAGAQRVFEPDFQPDPSLVQRPARLGIRLSLIQQILARHGGKIWVELPSAQRQSKDFMVYVLLPLARS